MPIYIQRNGQEHGPYRDEEARSHLGAPEPRELGAGRPTREMRVEGTKHDWPFTVSRGMTQSYWRARPSDHARVVASD